MNAGQGKSNRLISASSPYLLQHAHNPVDWYEWGQEALERARREDKPILVSIGYASCHWCHVMERESFENEETASIMNRAFVCIKVDREERPDIDMTYMEAVQAMNMQGGWPLNVFLTPDQVPFYGGTYFPPENWRKVLVQIDKAFRERRMEIAETATALKTHLQTSDIHRFASSEGMDGLAPEMLDKMVNVLHDRFDHTWGGIEKAPKFFMPSVWHLLLRCHALRRDQRALEMVLLTLRKASQGGLYDRVGGGFARYSTDVRWFAPHFEKMLYDNAQLISLYSEAYAVSGDDSFKHIVFQTIQWIKDEMLAPAGGVYSSIDADSEGVEGKFYTWTHQELQEHLAPPLSAYFLTTPTGNWEDGRNILCSPADPGAFLQNYQLDAATLDRMVRTAQDELKRVRANRPRPALDDKILTSWNAMLIQGLCDAYRAFQEPEFLQLAKKILDFIEKNLTENGRVYRTFRNSRNPVEGFMEDYAFLIQAYVSVYEITFDESRLVQAENLLNYCIQAFSDTEDGYFHFTASTAEKLISRKKEIFDNVIPSSNSVMARNMLRLGTLKNNSTWIDQAGKMAGSFRKLIESEPVYMSNWGILAAELIAGISEVVIAGPETESFRKSLQRNFLPFTITLGSTKPSTLPQFEGRYPESGTMIYVCRNRTCKLPVHSPEAALQQMDA